MNKRHIIPVFAVMIIAGCKNSNIEIKGSLENPETGAYIYLEELKSDKLISVDSVAISDDGTFSFSRSIKSPSFYLLETGSNFLTMLLEPGQKIELKAYYDSLNFPEYISGSKGTSLMIDYNLKLRQTIRKLSGLSEIYQQNLGKPELPVVMDRLDSMAQIHLNDINVYTKKYIDDNLNSLVCLVALYQQVAPREYILSREKDFRYFARVDSSLISLYPDYEPVTKLHEEVQQMASALGKQNPIPALAEEGAEAPEIILPNPSGDTIRLSSTRGKVVLLDFWASWCRPCREENPNLVKAYNLYHKDGFEIYQVSLDKTKEAWLKGIEEDHLERWIHVSDIRYWNSSVVTEYKIESIPANLLLDKDGRIIASNLRGELLQSKLAELFNSK